MIKVHCIRPQRRHRKLVFVCIVVFIIFMELYSWLEYSHQRQTVERKDYVIWEMADGVPTVILPPKSEAFPPFLAWNPPDGPGEWGKGLDVSKTDLAPEERAVFDDGWRRHHINVYVSDRISLTRRLPDLRPHECQQKRYPRQLPQVAVIICFHNEAWSFLLRTVHSVLSRSPPALLQEVILVDDFSDLSHLGAPLQQYVEALGAPVRLLRTDRREGLIRARIQGALAATAPVLVFLDSHCECFHGWLPPLVARVAEDWRTVPFPSIMTISDVDLHVVVPTNQTRTMVGGFSWRDLSFRWKEMSAKEQARRHSPADPARSPTMPGGLFAISKRWFHHLGEYDPSLEVWGGENMELSFKVWQCNGTVEMLPCSLVGHVFRMKRPASYLVDGAIPDVPNAAIVSWVWMDHYRNYFIEAHSSLHPDDKLPALSENIKSRLQLRTNLHCHDFRWYLENVYPDLFVPETATHVGKLKNVATSRCIQPLPSLVPQSIMPAVISMACEDIKRDICYLLKTGKGGIWNYTQDGHLYNEEQGVCMGIAEEDGRMLRLQPCRDTDFQRWILPARTWTPPVL